MQLKNRFREIDKHRFWDFHQFCAICLSNKNCSLHHIDSTLTDSIYSSIMLCYDHHKEADGHNQSDEEYKIYLMKFSIPVLFRIEKPHKENDLKYLESIHDRLKFILESI